MLANESKLDFNALKVAPFVKWVGGKRQLLTKIKQLQPKEFKNYYEPFVGGGAVLFNLRPKKAIINDANKPLMNAYCFIRDDIEGFIKKLSNLYEEINLKGKDFYYLARDRYNQKLQENQYDLELACLFVFLNKHCFNGLYRVNSKGLFNVPYNNKTKITIDEAVFNDLSKYLKEITILNTDFEKACKGAKKGDFIFFDSPYAPLSDTTFDAYTEEGFNKEDHIRLAKLFDKLTKRGCYCMLTNHDTELIRCLYDNKGYRIEVVEAKRSINSDAINRKGKEIIICNY
ncbi:DNA adenine methylase [[Mycoplasma] anseris]|uniref:site-specific DNA-methyltransferase (adenine-specific) n=2 Tax=[Mycoplasma] anseris TaxID=92400 RepID=A0A2Z4NDX9_9BACT|nr:DNA adenine methylase [[Mycoplasma] anseris]